MRNSVNSSHFNEPFRTFQSDNYTTICNVRCQIKFTDETFQSDSYTPVCNVRCQIEFTDETFQSDSYTPNCKVGCQIEFTDEKLSRKPMLIARKEKTRQVIQLLKC